MCLPVSSLLGIWQKVRQTPSLCSWSPSYLSEQWTNEYINRETATLQRIKIGEKVECTQEGLL